MNMQILGILLNFLGGIVLLIVGVVSKEPAIWGGGLGMLTGSGVQSATAAAPALKKDSGQAGVGLIGFFLLLLVVVLILKAVTGSWLVFLLLLLIVLAFMF